MGARFAVICFTLNMKASNHEENNDKTKPCIYMLQNVITYIFSTTW